MTRLDRNSVLPAAVAGPGYVPEAHGVGIVHLGIGAFHRAHQGVYTDAALARSGGDWRTLGVSLRGAEVAAQLNPQDGRYTLLSRGPGEPAARVVGSVAGVRFAPAEPAAVLRALADPAVRIASLTITEKGYGLDRTSGGLDRGHAGIAADLRGGGLPQSAVGLLVAALVARRAAGRRPLTVLSCDNFSANGAVARRLVLEFAGIVAPEAVDWIAAEGRFPATMVDRITPATTAATLAEVRGLIGCDDLAAVQAEPFTQWVIEDDFADGRPDWEAGGATFVRDVTPYEEMKLRMLNGAHSTLAYAGFLGGRAYVRDVMADAGLRALVARHLAAAAGTLAAAVQPETPAYAAALTERFGNPAIAHETYQIAMDGTQKLPQRIFAPALVALQRGQDVAPFAFSTAAWMRYALGRTDAGAVYALRDPREAEVAAAVRGGGDAAAVFAALAGLGGLMPERLAVHAEWRAAVVARLTAMLERGMAAAIAAEAAGLR